MHNSPLAYIWSLDPAVHSLTRDCYLKKYDIADVFCFKDSGKLFQHLELQFKGKAVEGVFLLIEESVPQEILHNFLKNLNRTIKYAGMPVLYLSESVSYRSLPNEIKSCMTHLDRNQNISMNLQHILQLNLREDQPVAAAAVETLNASQKSARILVAEDHANILRVLAKFYLPQLGFEKILTAVDGLEALTKLRLHKKQNLPVDIVIADWEMPKLSGLDLFTTALKEDLVQPSHFILLTAHSQLEDVKKAIAAGITTYITKPIEPEVILEKLSKIQ